MATRNIPAPSNPYASGAVVFDSTPYTEFYIREQQKEQAKDEALDKYFQEWDKSINPAGMRNIDTQDFLNLVNENKDYYFKNKAAIKNPALDGGKAYSEWNARGKSAMGLVSQSKNAAAKEAEYGKMILKAKQNGLPIPESTLKLIEQYRQAIKSPNWRDINPEELDFIPKKFDPLSFGEKVWKGIPFNTKVEKIPSKEEGYFDEVTTQVVPEDAYGAIRRKAYTEYENDATTKYAVDLASTNPSEFQRYNDIFQKQYGDKIRSKGDLATAIALEFSPIGKGETKEKASRDEKYWFRQAEAGRNKRAAMRAAEKGGGDAVLGNIMEEIDLGEMELGKGKKIIISQGEVFNSDKTPYNGQIFIKRDDLPASLYSALKAMNTDNDFLKVNKGFTAKIVDGQIESLSDKYIGNVDRRFLENAQLKLNTEPQKGRQMQFGRNRQQRPQGQQNTGRKYRGLDKNGNPIFE